MRFETKKVQIDYSQFNLANPDVNDSLIHCRPIYGADKIKNKQGFSRIKRFAGKLDLSPNEIINQIFQS